MFVEMVKNAFREKSLFHVVFQGGICNGLGDVNCAVVNSIKVIMNILYQKFKEEIVIKYCTLCDGSTHILTKKIHLILFSTSWFQVYSFTLAFDLIYLSKGQDLPVTG
jgi:hypothetical protein